VSVLVRPDVDDLRLVGTYVGRVLVGIAAVHVPAIVVALALREIDDAAAMVVGASLAYLIGTAAVRRFRTEAALDWAHGLVTVALAWLVAPLPLAASLWLSGHFALEVDAYFEAISGLTTSGLTMLQDLDHLGAGMNLLRHLTHFAGGQGVILVVLTVLASGNAQLGTLFVGEGRDERIVPSVVRTARLIYVIATAWLLAGTLAIALTLLHAGLGPWRSALHAVSLFFAAFDTGGFSIQSTSVAYYHSGLVEAVLIVVMFAGAISFPMHYDLWQRRVRAAGRHLDLRMFATTTTVLTTVVLVGLGLAGTYETAQGLSRKGLFTALSAATNTGFAVLPGAAYDSWGQLAPAALVTIMLIGSMAGSTAGGIKTIRVALVLKSVLRDVRKALAPPAGVVVATYAGRRRHVVTDEQVRAAVTMTVLYVVTAVGGSLLHVYHGASIEQGLFESTSATANVGLSVGVIGPDNPLSLKLLTMFQMWAGRLEFLAVFGLFGYGVAYVRGRR
jgi:trk system potassium uptake protein TrkH